MRKIHIMPTQARLHELFIYSFVEGALYRRGENLKRAGSINGGRGYRRITVDYTAYTAHRLVWTYFYGDPGELLVDHINKVRDDDRIENLRLASERENRRNSRMYCTNTSGFKGVTLEKAVNKWKAYIYVNNKRKHLGLFPTKEKAAAAYEVAARRLHGEFMGVTR